MNFSWQRQKIAMTPLFAASQTQSQPLSQLQEASSLSVGMIRETQQNLEFTPTQDQGDTGNWMNPSIQVRLLIMIANLFINELKLFKHFCCLINLFIKIS